MAVAEEAGQLRVRAGGGRGRRRLSLCAGAGFSGSRMEELRFGPGLGGRNGLALGTRRQRGGPGVLGGG